MKDLLPEAPKSRECGIDNSQSSGTNWHITNIKIIYIISIVLETFSYREKL